MLGLGIPVLCFLHAPYVLPRAKDFRKVTDSGLGVAGTSRLSSECMLAEILAIAEGQSSSVVAVGAQPATLPSQCLSGRASLHMEGEYGRCALPGGTWHSVWAAP